MMPEYYYCYLYIQRYGIHPYRTLQTRECSRQGGKHWGVSLSLLDCCVVDGTAAVVLVKVVGGDWRWGR